MRSPLAQTKIRIDGKGSGKFCMPRGWRIHQGIDLEAMPGEVVFAPEKAKVVRAMFPYGSKSPLRGILLRSDHIIHKLMYCEMVSSELIGTMAEEGQAIGIMQDVRVKYGDDMTPHLHWETIIDPEMLLKLAVEDEQ